MEDVQPTSPATEEQTPASQDAPNEAPGFGERGRIRRRARFLRKARELAYRDLGGLVFSLHRFGQRNDTLVLAKLSTLGQIDAELRSLEGALAEHQPVTVLRDAGIAACPRCAAIHGSEDRFCPNCGLAMDRRAERPVAGPPTSTPPASPPAPAPAPAPAPTGGATSPPADPAPAAPTSSPPATPAPAGYTTIDRPAPSPQTPAPAPSASPASPAPGAPATAPTDQEQPTVIVRPPGSGA